MVPVPQQLLLLQQRQDELVAGFGTQIHKTILITYYYTQIKIANRYNFNLQMKCASMGGFLCNIDEAHENTYIRHHLAMYQGKQLTRINFHFKKE